MLIERTVTGIRRQVAAWREAGESIALVPTMGALHEGHLSLVRQARLLADRVIVSLFVNPTQFLPNEDLSRYPRNEESDAAALTSGGADLLYAPEIAEIYPDGFRTTVTVKELTSRWEGEIRPGHFDGVATVVTKLFTQTAPDIALFGEKDYQQLQVIKRFTRDLDLPIEIVGCPTIREESGLALSSRNAYLNDAQLALARTFNRVLSEACGRVAVQPEKFMETMDDARLTLLDTGFTAVDYLAVCDRHTLEPLAVLDRPARLIAAVRLGGIRLLDNFPVG